MKDEFPEVTKMYDRLRSLCSEGKAEDALQLAKQIADDSIGPASRMVAFIKEAIESDHENMLPPARIFFNEILKNGDLHRVLIMADAITLGKGRIGERLAKEVEQLLDAWWNKVIYPKFSERTLAEQLVFMEMAVRDCTYDTELFHIIGLVEHLKLSKKHVQAKAHAKVILEELLPCWHRQACDLPSSIWVPILAGFKALAIS